MGSTNWSTDAYTEAARLRKSAKKSDFAYSDAAHSNGRWQIHPTLDPKWVTLRESRDSETHPCSNAISILFDETGSMGKIPRIFQQKLVELMKVLLLKGYIQDPQILFGAFGDATCDRIPLQVGQFESGVEMDEHLRNIVLEGGGGGTNHESYELPLYFLAEHTAIDCWEKRGSKGYAFLIGDEKAYPFVNKQQIANLIGDTLQQDIPLQDIIAQVQRRYHLFFIFPRNASHGNDIGIQNFWKNLLGQNVIFLDDENAVCETIALAIGLTEEAINLAAGEQDLYDAGANTPSIKAATRALQVYASKKGIITTGANLSDLIQPDNTGGSKTERI